MNIPDQSHINHIRELLWNTNSGGASVMIGAGFSRNAVPNSASAKDFPLWSQVARNLCSKLYPPSEKSRLEQALSEATGTSGFLRLAQEYEIAFGRGSLHSFINDSVPDTDYQPSELHYQLLELPWKEVLTTNWDTLLERTQFEIPERSYSIIRTVDELANTPSPRIIKLHGTVPAHIPFIFTEEDYRTYPKKFAPFVNTVQQIMMETAVLLLGFSGDDPNFLQWSGWVKDNLGASSPKIYLAGWLNLSPHRRRMLENNNVVPIDVSKHPKANDWPEHLRHQYATEWIIRTLQCGQSYNYKDWPSIRNYCPPQIEDYLEPIEPNPQQLPLTISRIGRTDPIQVKTLLEVLNTWEHNRKIYPNWVIYPIDKHYNLDRTLNEWVNVIIENFNNFTLLDKLKFLNEIVWLYKQKLVPLPPEIEAIWDDIATKFDFDNKTVDSLNYASEWASLIKIYIENSLSSITNKRLALDSEGFYYWLNQLKNFKNHSIEINNSVIHEECQWLLLNLDFKNLENLLEQWNVSNSDPIWMFRKASLLLELNLEDEAYQLMSQGFTIIKKNPDKFNEFSNSSREGWALLSIQFLMKNGEKKPQLKIKKFNIQERFKQLELLNCNTESQLINLIERIKQRKDIEEINQNPCFDLYRRRGERVTFNNYKYEAITHAYQCLLLCETAGLPLSVQDDSVGSSLIMTLIENYDLIDKRITSRVVVRLKPTDDDKLINNIYSRISIASLNDTDFEKLLNQIDSLLTYSLTQFRKKPNYFWAGYICTCLELISRLIIRLNDDQQINSHLIQSINFFQDNSLRRNLWLQKSLSNYLKRCWEACNSKIKKQNIIKVLQLPINCLLNNKEQQLINIESFLKKIEVEKLCSRTLENESEWKTIINLIISGLESSNKPRWDACLRLNLIYSFINKDEIEIIKKSLWRNTEELQNEFPIDTNLYDFNYITNLINLNLELKNLFLKKYLTISYDFSFLNRSILELSQAIDFLILSDDQIKTLFENIKNWSNSIPIDALEFDGFPHPFNETPSKIIETFSNINTIALNINIPEYLAEILFMKMKFLIQYDIYSYYLVGALIKALPDKNYDINTYLRKGIISDIPDNSRNAMYGLFLWVQQTLNAQTKSIPHPSDDLIREIGLAIATRRKNTLIQALLAATIIFKANDSQISSIISTLILEGLEYLILEQDYNSSHDDIEDVPIIRLNCVKLAYQMSINGFGDKPIIKQWLDEGEKDPLPEIRNAILQYMSDN
ncbi:SIR2 family NAD-dependent protein deacylase [Acinetobacter baumannii]|uniref:SIR2 family NAD-dependent protein deacylase n=1 Tax=Acinetobacter baumannii TaxID=470 RepID=UPI00070B5325|nr:SIR2 family protein [Acinetobacter baumannii]KRI29329.1 hypothetical protein APB98_14680 [Acinetobacter baumannii]